MQLILASGSPRRRELLARICPRFIVEPSLFEESAKGLSAYDTVLAFARGKAKDVLSRNPCCAVLGADTVVELGGNILGKPHSKEEAKEMLSALSGREHAVYTGVCLVSAEKEFSLVSRTLVRFRELSRELIEAYVASGKPFDKAGAYGIQDGYDLVADIEGSYTGVVGLPVRETRSLIEKHGGIPYYVETCD